MGSGTSIRSAGPAAPGKRNGGQSASLTADISVLGGRHSKAIPEIPDPEGSAGSPEIGQFGARSRH